MEIYKALLVNNRLYAKEIILISSNLDYLTNKRNIN